MTKVRTLLGILILGLSLAGAALWQTGLKLEFKVVLTGLDVLLWIAASVTLMFNVFSLDSQGRIPYNSLAWKYFSLFFGEKNEEGKTVVSVPDKIKICPMYWLVVLGIFLTSAALAIGSLFIAIIYFAVSGYLMGIMSTSNFMLFIAVIVFVLVFCYSLYKAESRKSKSWEMVTISLFAVLMLAVCLFAIHSMLLTGMTIFAIIMKAAIFAGIVIINLVGLILFCVLFGILILAISSRVKNNLLGQFIGAVYGRFCPVIPVESAPRG